MKRLILVATLSLSLPAQALTGNKLYEFCTTPGPELESFCISYIWASSEDLHFSNYDPRVTRVITRQIHNTRKPAAITPQQIADIVKYYLRDNPKERSDSTSSSVLLALRKVFPRE